MWASERSGFVQGLDLDELGVAIHALEAVLVRKRAPRRVANPLGIVVGLVTFLDGHREREAVGSSHLKMIARVARFADRKDVAETGLSTLAEDCRGEEGVHG